MKETVNIGVIGLGNRGSCIVPEQLLNMYDLGARVTAICDIYEDRIERTAKHITEKTGIEPFKTTDYKEIIARDDIDAIVVSSAWETHIEVAIKAMRAGKRVGIEVGGAYDISDCWRLVEAYEETGIHCMLLENCCYDDRELTILNMVRQGLFGDIVHCEGSYMHDLRGEISNGKRARHYRLRNYVNRCCENYPTHELGPIAKVLDINNGNRFVSLVSVASCAKGLHHFINDRYGADDDFANTNFNQGDIVTTIIKCAGGQTITICLDTTLPRLSNRRFTVQGVKGSYICDNNTVFIDGVHSEEKAGEARGNYKEYHEKYRHPLWQKELPNLGHGGMDWLIFAAFVDYAKNGGRPPIDTYDAAALMSIGALSEESIAKGSMPVYVPDFTRGKWYMRNDIEDTYYNLDRIEGYKY